MRGSINHHFGNNLRASSCDAKPSLINVNLILATKPREYSREYTNERRSNYFDRHDVIFALTACQETHRENNFKNAVTSDFNLSK